MAYKVKCAVTGEKGTNDTFVKIKGKYYKSQEVYDNAQKQKDLYKEIKNIICYELLDYQTGQKFPTMLTKKLKELEFYDNEVILNTINNCKNDISYWMNRKNIESDTGKIYYIFAVMSSHINDEYRKWKRESQRKIKEEKSEINIGHDISIENIGTNVKGKDISAWLEDD